jgi:GMP synthase (glutamine-hydrolysing)
VREFGYAEVRARGHTALLNGIEDFTTPEGHGMLKVWMSHGDKVTELPPGFKLMASTQLPDRRHGRRGAPLLRRAVPPRSHAHRAGQGAARALRARHLRRPARLGDARPHRRGGGAIREQVGDEEVILGLSGGVDSSVAAALIHRAIGDQLTCVFVDHGLLRLNEATW